jgi:type VI secretion system protein ImpF
MAELTPLEMLQPCLLDRLADDEPGKKEESRQQRVISLQRYKRGVLRDLEWLLNSSAHLPVEGQTQVELADYPEAYRSVLNFGTRQLCGLLAPNTAELERQLLEVIQYFEPRILRNSLTVTATMNRQAIGFEIQGEIWANPIPEHLFIKTKMDLETSHFIGESGDG